MKSSSRILCGLLLLALLSVPTLGQNAPAKPTTPKDALTGIYAVMVKQLNLSDDQQTKLGGKVLAMQAELKDWHAKNDAAVTKMKADYKAAITARDNEKAKLLATQYRQLFDTRDAMLARSRQEMLGVLTPEQEKAWRVYVLDQSLLKSFQKVKLTDEQAAKIKALCEPAITEIKILGESNPKAQSKIRMDVYSSVAQYVLTNAQRAQLKAPAAKPKAKQESATAPQVK